MRRIAVLLGATLGASTLTGCGSSGGAAALVVYSGQHEQTVNAVVAAFERTTGISVVVRSDDEDTLAAQIENEGTSSPADVIWTENSPALQFLSDAGRLAGVDPATLSSTTRRYDGPAGDWVGVSARVSALVFDPRRIPAARVPRSVLELASPRFAGMLALAPGETDFQPIVTAVLQAEGHARALRWLEGIASNATGNVVAGDEAVMNEVDRGLAALGVVNQYYWFRQRAAVGPGADVAKLAYFDARDPGYVVDVSGAAVLRSSSHRRAAQRFLAFLVSAEAQRIIASPARSMSFEYPLCAGVVVGPGQPPFATLHPYPITVAQLGDGAGAVDLLRDAGLL